MIYLVSIALFLLVGFTSKYVALRIFGLTLGIGLATTVVTGIVLALSCYGSKILSYNFCGELSGLFHIAATSIFFGVVSGLVVFICMVRKVKLVKK